MRPDMSSVTTDSNNFTLYLFFFQEIAVLHSEAWQKLEMLTEQKQFFENEVNNNKETEAKISVITRSAVRLRDDYNKLLHIVDDLASEVSNLPYRYQFHTELFPLFFLHCQAFQH